ncbi:hypothetical protein [Geomicrobium sediminis]|uniref:Uncharacterized protein n=1 Tax=Geomicrobium sediminis TaxID=1347788 RepID=A0ABS2PJD6_9BACL|nr:hypothetical protein [Geomicrobium sediminis]MBM7634933.1 hypothetical protein [Geomicrobium sediminis]
MIKAKTTQVGFEYVPPVSQLGIGFYRVTVIATGERLHIAAPNWTNYVVAAGYVDRRAIMGGCELDLNAINKGVVAV